MDKKTIKHARLCVVHFAGGKCSGIHGRCTYRVKKNRIRCFYRPFQPPLLDFPGGIVGGVTYKWKHNTLLSILIGTVVYMVLLWVR